jgi:transposase-like protein
MRKMGIVEAGSRPEWETLEGFVRVEAQRFIQRVLEEEVEEFLGRGKSERRAVAGGSDGYRNGYGKTRKVSLSVGTVEVRRPRVRGVDEKFESKVLPLFKRQSKEVQALLQELYLHGLSLRDFDLAMRGLLGDGAPLSPATMLRLKSKWAVEYDEWKRRDLSDLELVYMWGDGIYVKAGLDDTKAALLVLVGALSDGSKVVLAVESGHRESIESWSSVLRDLKARGLRAPKLTTGDGALGLWGALRGVYPQSAEQRCWNHKMVNVLDQLPKKLQEKGKAAVQKIWHAESLAEAEKWKKEFRKTFGGQYPKAVEILEKDWQMLTAYYAFPKEHWKHLRTTNIIESPFSAVRLRTSAAKRYKRVDNATAMIWRLALVAEKTFRKLNAPELCAAIFRGALFRDGVRMIDTKDTTKSSQDNNENNNRKTNRKRAAA